MTSADQAPGDEQQIRALLEARLAALRAKDASQFVAAFDATIVKFDLAPPLQEQGSSVLDPAGLQWWLDTWDGQLTVELAQVGISVGGDVAFCHCLEHIQGTRTDGQDQDMWTRSTLGLKKVDDAWKITHEHNSAPLYMDGSGALLWTFSRDRFSAGGTPLGIRKRHESGSCNINDGMSRQILIGQRQQPVSRAWNVA
jgi:ketosteroid isomerase-like protein